MEHQVWQPLEMVIVSREGRDIYTLASGLIKKWLEGSYDDSEIEIERYLTTLVVTSVIKMITKQ